MPDITRAEAGWTSYPAQGQFCLECIGKEDADILREIQGLGISGDRLELFLLHKSGRVVGIKEGINLYRPASLDRRGGLIVQIQHSRTADRQNRRHQKGDDTPSIPQAIRMTGSHAATKDRKVFARMRGEPTGRGRVCQ